MKPNRRPYDSTHHKCIERNPNNGAKQPKKYACIINLPRETIIGTGKCSKKNNNRMYRTEKHIRIRVCELRDQTFYHPINHLNIARSNNITCKCFIRLMRNRLLLKWKFMLWSCRKHRRVEREPKKSMNWLIPFHLSLSIISTTMVAFSPSASAADSVYLLFAAGILWFLSFSFVVDSFFFC